MFHFKCAQISDIPVIISIADVSFRNTYKDILSPQQLEWMMEWMYSEQSLKNQLNEGQKFFILYSDNIACGYISIEEQEKTLFHFQKIYLLPSFQGLGLGRMLIEKGVEYIRSLNNLPARVELNVNRNNKAQEFYKKMGFEIVSQGDFSIGNGYFMNDYIMGMNID
ncbi:MAG: GNAT family N-acetyltransferase [Bacteroidales bacterium]|nr:GNAT family N-acetyltransferase [Bacteroidales bacterium]